MNKAEMKYLRRLAMGSREKSETRKARKELEEYVERISDNLARVILQHYLLDGWTWQRIACEMGWVDESTPRLIAARYM